MVRLDGVEGKWESQEPVGNPSGRSYSGSSKRIGSILANILNLDSLVGRELLEPVKDDGIFSTR